MLTWAELETQRETQIRRFIIGRRVPNGTERVLYMTMETYDKFQSKPWPATEQMSLHVRKERGAAMRSVLRRYLAGGHLNLRYDVKELGSEPLSPAMRGFWEFRSGPPREQTRLFGFFVRPGAFVATSFKARGELDSDAEGMGNQLWQEERAFGLSELQRIFGACSVIEAPWPVLTQENLAVYLEREDERG